MGYTQKYLCINVSILDGWLNLTNRQQDAVSPGRWDQYEGEQRMPSITIVLVMVGCDCLLFK